MENIKILLDSRASSSLGNSEHVLNAKSLLAYQKHIINHLGKYDMILGRDVLQELGIDLDLKNSITWEDYQANMKSADVTLAEHVANIEATKSAAADIAKRLDVKYQKKHKELFNGTLGMLKNI
eukprot:9422669-Ditylum_brightwellii.AAC.1